jgi:hypothetical protein
MRRFRWVLSLLALSLPVEAIAQQPGTALSEPYRKWDIGGGVALRFGQQDDAVVPAGAWTAEFGRYWTAHIKTSVAVMTAGQTTYASSTFDSQSYTTREIFTRPAGFGAAATYQFLDNEFVHPYVTAGVRFGSTSTSTTISSTRPPYSLLSNNSPYRIEARQIFGGGFKSYFGNGRAFMRSELLVAIGPGGTTHPVLQIGAGVDF